MIKNGCWERKKPERELDVYHIGPEKTGADGRAPTERVAGTAEKGKYHDVLRHIFARFDLSLSMNKYMNKWHII